MVLGRLQADLVQRIIFVLLTEFHYFDSLQCKNFLVRFSHYFVDSAEGALSYFVLDHKIPDFGQNR